MNSTIILNNLLASDPSFAHVHDFNWLGVFAFVTFVLAFTTICIIDPDRDFIRFRFRGR